MNYIGYFKSLQDILYSVTIKGATDNSTPKEITLGGEAPFVVRYESSATPFEPMRNSTATISIVSDNYFEDILPSAPQEVEVILKDETNNKNIWKGYLAPRIYNQEYENCIETIELEASDSLSIIQYKDYVEINNRSIVTFKDIISAIIDGTNLNGFYWPKSKIKNSTYVLPDKLKISEVNFFSSDTEEAWKQSEVLGEMCKYLGLTAIQYGDNLYFVDYTALNLNDSCQYVYYPKATDYGESSTITLGGAKTITQDNIRGNGSEITFEPIYNKIYVKDNFYACDNLIPNIFDDNYLTNRGTDFYSSFEVEPFDTPANYPWGSNFFSQKFVDEEKDDTYRFFHRIYDHKNYESIYRNALLNTVTTSLTNHTETTRNYIGGTILDLGIVKKDYFDKDLGDYVVPNKVDWTRYLCINQAGKGWMADDYGIFTDYVPETPSDNMVIFKLKDGFKGNVLLDNLNAYLIIDLAVLFEKYQKRNYINPEWSTDAVSMEGLFVTGTQILQTGICAFKLGIGGKYWNGYKWVNEPTTFRLTFAKEGQESKAYINTEKKVLNNISWTLGINEEGYKIPLTGVDTTGEIEFEIYMPSLQIITDYANLEPTEYNGYCWIKDFSIKTVTTGQDREVEENDIVYENIINEDNVNEISDITLKFTTSVPVVKPSYSNVIYEELGFNSLLFVCKEIGLNSSQQKPEENIVEKYYQQYSTPTKKLKYTLDINHTPFDKYYGVDVDNPETGYVQLGTEIDYCMDRQIITLIEKK